MLTPPHNPKRGPGPGTRTKAALGCFLLLFCLPEFERVINLYHLIVPQFVQPLKDNPRILKQDGAFIISGLDKDQTDSDRKIRKFVSEEITISGNYKKDIMKQLEIVGIHQASLFPEVEMVADYLKNR